MLVRTADFACISTFTHASTHVSQRNVKALDRGTQNILTCCIWPLPLDAEPLRSCIP